MSIPEKIFLTIGVAAVYTAIIVVMVVFNAPPVAVGFNIGFAVAYFAYRNIPAIWWD